MVWGLSGHTLANADTVNQAMHTNSIKEMINGSSFCVGVVLCFFLRHAYSVAFSFSQQVKQYVNVLEWFKCHLFWEAKLSEWWGLFSQLAVSWLYLIRTGQSVGTWLAKAGINSHTAPIPMLHAWITHRGNGTAQFHMLVHFSKPDQNVCPFLEQKLPYNIPTNVIRKAAHSFRFDIWTKLYVLIDYICMMHCMWCSRSSFWTLFNGSVEQLWKPLWLWCYHNVPWCSTKWSDCL